MFLYFIVTNQHEVYVGWRIVVVGLAVTLHSADPIASLASMCDGSSWMQSKSIWVYPPNSFKKRFTKENPKDRSYCWIGVLAEGIQSSSILKFIFLILLWNSTVSQKPPLFSICVLKIAIILNQVSHLKDVLIQEKKCPTRGWDQIRPDSPSYSYGSFCLHLLNQHPCILSKNFLIRHFILNLEIFGEVVSLFPFCLYSCCFICYLAEI